MGKEIEHPLIKFQIFYMEYTIENLLFYFSINCNNIWADAGIISFRLNIKMFEHYFNTKSKYYQFCYYLFKFFMIIYVVFKIRLFYFFIFFCDACDIWNFKYLKHKHSFVINHVFVRKIFFFLFNHFWHQVWHV